MTLTVAVRTMKNEDSPPPDYDLLQSPNSHYENTKVSSRAKTIPHPTVIKSLILEDQRSGTFLLRPSSHPHYLYTISVNKKEDGGQTTKAPDFTTIGNLVCYYMHKHAKAYYEDADAFRLLYPYRKRVVSLQTLAGEEIIRNTQRSQLGNLFIMKNFGSIHSIL
ncbi:DgyrCDS3547 [Dimorphilus gyrociliatus]|uniref:DgyrCDS3547 n=1 Tax=Dimorphilus gyrociliatus TaxID=2664684 RepID=A0A7I8VE24_9ANNE|nr:DgyrCDS3547 [Dimorphilus gyrociliatus]